MALPFSVTYTKQGTALYEIDLSQVENIVGLSPQIYWNGHKQLTKNSETGKWEYNFGEQEQDAATAISHYLAYNGGTVDVDFRHEYSKWGMEKELPTLSAPASLSLSADSNVYVGNASIVLNVVAKDAQGYYLPSDKVEYSSSDTGDKFKADTLTLSNSRGVHTITATMDELMATYDIMCVASYHSKNVIEGKTGVTCEHVTENSVTQVTDDDRISYLKWFTSEADWHNHYITYDLTEIDSEGLYVEAVEVYFEGAYAKKFHVTLSNTLPDHLNVPAENAISVLADTAAEDVVLNNTTESTQHYLLQDNVSAKHKYVTLTVEEPVNYLEDYGIKLRDMKVFATSNDDVVSVEGIADDDANAPVEYYDLNGIRLNGAELAPGLYIKKQGSKAEKVLVK